MNTLPMTSYKPFQKIHPLSLLAQQSSRQASGCLQLTNQSGSWFIYLQQGKLFYASNSLNPFERLDRHLRRLSIQVPSLVSAVRVQVRLLFDKPLEDSYYLVPDYQAICWLVEQQHLDVKQAASLIEGLAKEVLESFLSIKEASYELIREEQFSPLTKLCLLDLRPLVELCQTQLRQRQPSTQSTELLTRQSPPASQNGRNSLPSKPAKVPVAPPPEVAITTPIEPPKASAASLKKSQYTIACIDDSPTVLQAIKSFLNDKSFSVLMIDNPVKALMEIIRNKPDLILLDVTMPNLDGYELCSLLRKHPNFKQTPIIMVTGNTGFIDRAKAKLVGSSGYLTKPFTQSDLVKIVFKYLV